MAFILSKLTWVFLSPANLMSLLLLTGGFFAMSQNERVSILGRRLCFDIAFLLFFFSILPVGDWLLVPLENRFPVTHPAHIDGIILLGGDENPRLSLQRGQPVMQESARRMMAFAELARAYPQAKLAYTGGTGMLTPDTKTSQADVARDGLNAIGVPVDKMVFEGQSRNTHENAVFLFNIVHPAANETWLLVTSAYHMPRAMGCFEKAGWHVAAAPTGYLTDGTMSTRLQFNLVDHLREITDAAHEYYGLLAYRLLGYTDSLWPS